MPAARRRAARLHNAKQGGTMRIHMIGAGAIVLPRRTIGEGSIVGAGSIVTRDIPDHVVAFGQPARVVRRLNPPEELAS